MMCALICAPTLSDVYADGSTRKRSGCFPIRRYVAEAEVELWWWGTGGWGVVADDKDKDCTAAHATTSWSAEAYRGPNGDLWDEDLFCRASAFRNSDVNDVTGYTNSIYLRFGKAPYKPTKELKETFNYKFRRLRDVGEKNYISNSVSFRDPDIGKDYLLLKDVKADLTMVGLSDKFVNTIQIVAWVKDDMSDDNEEMTSDKIIWECKAVLDSKGFHCYGALNANDVTVSESVRSANVKISAKEKRILIPKGVDPDRIEIVSFVDGKSEVDFEELMVKEITDKVVINPNPATESVDFTYQVLDRQKRFTVELLDQSNNVVAQKVVKTAADNRYSIGCENLPAGVYLLRVKTMYAIETKRVLIR